MIKYPVSKPSLSGMELDLVSECFADNQLTHGPMVQRFEKQFAEYVGAPFALACSSGTTALHLALLALNIGPGDEVLVPDVSFVATANAVSYTGATPVLVDIEPLTWSMNLKKASEAITDRTKAIIIVHLYGQPADMDNVARLAHKHNLRIVEDAAEGLGGNWNGCALGTMGDIGTFSFYGNKILTTGEGGMCVTPDVNLLTKMRHYRGQGQHPMVRYFHTTVGYNYRMTDVQAAIGVGQLDNLDSRVQDRWRIFKFYDTAFGAWKERTTLPGAAPWLYTLELPHTVDPIAVGAELLQKGIETRPIFVPMHKLPMYEQSDDNFPESCALHQRGLSFPTYNGLTADNVQEIVLEFFRTIQADNRKQA